VVSLIICQSIEGLIQVFLVFDKLKL